MRLDFSTFIITAFMILAAIIAVYKIISEFCVIIKKPFGEAKQRKEDHELLLKTVEDLKELHEKHEEDTLQSIKHDEAIENKLETLTDLFIDGQISTMRWDINNFATKISENKPCNKDCFKHCFSTYEKYENILKEQNLTNGEVEISMKIIKEAYQEKMKNGEF